MQNKTCPQCKKNGESVESNIIEKYAVDEIHVNDKNYYICMNPACNVVYFNNKAPKIFNITDLQYKVCGNYHNNCSGECG
ncbi:MAG: hypothetical protein ACOCZT_01650 [Halanaerobiales bacterium]